MNSLAADREARINEVLAEHMLRADAGKRYDRSDLYAQHADIADKLVAYYEVSDRLYHLIDACEQSESALTQSLAPTRDKKKPKRRRTASPARVFADYELIEEIARGGMGVVYKARQQKLNRIVALKMILAGQFADDADVERFYVEAEAAAHLRHPNIVAVHEIGEFEGQHFFSMDFIEGRTLDDLVSENPLTPQRAVGYVQKIAETMQFAHDKGVVHRDLKPSNIIVDKNDEPLIMDFGLAKRTEGEQSQLTMSGVVVGTPSYMSPEQASAKNEEVTARSDVYAIGAILYTLLTDRPPFRAANAFETLRQVLEAEPPSPRVLNPGIPRDLDTICLKCLQKEPHRRYASAQELSEELGRFVAGKPIHARPIGVVQRGWRWCRRNPVVAATTTAALVFLITALVVTTVAYFKTSAALAEADESFRQAQQAVDELFTEVSENDLFNTPGMQPVRERLLRRALAYYERFREQRGDDPTVQDELATTTFRVGLITEAIESPEAALVEYRRAQKMQSELLAETPHDVDRLQSLGNTWTAIGRVLAQTKQFDDSLAAYDEAVGMRERLTKIDAGNSEYQRLLANVQMNIGLVQQARGAAEWSAGNNAGAAKHGQAALKQIKLAQQIRDEALRSDSANMKLRRDRAKGCYNLANALIDAGDLDAAEQQLDNAIDAFRELAGEEEAALDDKHRLAICLRRAGDLPEDLDEAFALYEEALDILQPLARQNPLVVKYQGDLAGLHLQIGQLHRDGNEIEAAREKFLRARQILELLMSQYPHTRYDDDLQKVIAELDALHNLPVPDNTL